MTAALALGLGLGLTLDPDPEGPVPPPCCSAHPAGCCPDHYRRELEPRDDTIAELQSVVVAMRHRGDPGTLRELDDALWGEVVLVLASRTPTDRIKHSMALAAIAVRYREEIPHDR